MHQGFQGLFSFSVLLLGARSPPSSTDAEVGRGRGDSTDCPFILPYETPLWMITVPNDNDDDDDDDYNGEAAAADDNDDEGR